jgi:hypothetical protein
MDHVGASVTLFGANRKRLTLQKEGRVLLATSMATNVSGGSTLVDWSLEFYRWRQQFDKMLRDAGVTRSSGERPFESCPEAGVYDLARS